MRFACPDCGLIVLDNLLGGADSTNISHITGYFSLLDGMLLRSSCKNIKSYWLAHGIDDCDNRRKQSPAQLSCWMACGFGSLPNCGPRRHGMACLPPPVACVRACAR